MTTSDPSAVRNNLPRPMTEEEVMAAALADPDALPMTPEQLKNAKRRPRVTVIRRALRMTQEQFATAFKIPLNTLQDWEQERAEPDAPARAYLRAIAGNAEAVAKALRTHPRAVAAE